MTTQGRFTPLSATLPPKPAGAEVAMFKTGMPVKAFSRVARLDVHIERTHLIPPTLVEARAELEEQARRAGADAIIEVREQRSSVGETLIYHVTATGIRYH